MFRKSHKILLGRTVDVLGSLHTLELTNLYIKLQGGNQCKNINVAFLYDSVWFYSFSKP